MTISQEEFERRLSAVAKTHSIHIDALRFLFRAVQAESKRDESDYSEAEFFCWHVRDLAFMEFGGEVRAQFADWNIHSTLNIGEIVFVLVDEGLMSVESPDSKIGDFEDVFDFETAFDPKFLKPVKPLKPSQWKLSTLFVLVTVSAIAVAGAKEQGLIGAARTLFSAWIALAGAFCLSQSFQDRKNERMLLAIGLVLLGGGALMFYLTS